MICPYMKGEEIQVLQEKQNGNAEENSSFIENISCVIRKPAICMEEQCAAWCKQRQRCEYHRIFRD